MHTLNAFHLDAPESTQITRAFETAFAMRNYQSARALFERHSLVIWFGIRVERLGHMLDDIVADDPSLQDTAAGFQVLLSSTQEQRFYAPRVVQAMQTNPTSSGLMLRFGYLLDLRLRGHVREASSLFNVLRGDLSMVQPYGDRRNSWPQFLAVQQGITSMLAGECERALHHFREALARRTPAGLEVLRRNALIRSALIEAAFGDAQTARIFHDRANKIERSESWAEAELDASSELVTALLEPDPHRAGRILETINIADLSEMWPFYVIASYIVYDRAGAHLRVGSRLESIENIPFGRIEGEGLPGSVLPVGRCLYKLHLGATHRAREFLEKADQGHILTKAAHAIVELCAGDPHNTIRITDALRTQTRELRTVEIIRISLAAEAHIALGHEEDAVSALFELEHLFEPLRTAEAELFSKAVSELGIRHYPGWPSPAPSRDSYFDRLPSRQELLTDRELDILKLLAKGLTRPQIAETQFVSLNTLKTQLRSIYRKLGATSRADALSKATNRGIL